jgi:hypothetical protein
LKKERSYGPPNFGEDPRHDEKLTIFVLSLESPVDVVGDPKEPEEPSGRSVKDVRKVQLICSPDRLPSCAALAGKKVTVTGTVTPQITIWHRTDVLLEVSDLKPQQSD